MTIQAAELYHFAVKLEPVFSEAGLAKARAPLILIDRGLALPDSHNHSVEVGIRQVPKLDGAKVR